MECESWPESLFGRLSSGNKTVTLDTIEYDYTLLSLSLSLYIYMCVCVYLKCVFIILMSYNCLQILNLRFNCYCFEKFMKMDTHYMYVF